MKRTVVVCMLAMLCLTAATDLPSVQQLTEQLSHPSLYTSAVDTAPPDRQQTMRRVIASLPQAELQSLGLEVKPDGSVDITDDQLEFLWEERQKQLKQVFQETVKPKEHFAAVVKQLQEQNGADLVQTLTQLEELLTDIDMATDFHALGHWEVLATFLSEQHASVVRAAAAWTVGTAVKNSYDHQLWLLEGDRMLGDLLQMLGDACSSPEAFEAGKKAMYAIGAGSRGNADVQAALRQRDVVSTFRRLFDTCATAGLENQAMLAAKMWQYVSDLLDERFYVQNTLLADTNELSVEDRQKLQELELLGDKFAESQWYERAIVALHQASNFSQQSMPAATREAVDAILAVVRAHLQLHPSIVGNAATILMLLETPWEDASVVAQQVLRMVKPATLKISG